MKTSQSLLRNASSPDRGALGRPGQPCCSLGPNGAQGGGPCPNGQQLRNCALTKDARQAVMNRNSGARSFPIAENFTRPVQPSPARQWLSSLCRYSRHLPPAGGSLSYQGSWREAPERLYPKTPFRRFALPFVHLFSPMDCFFIKNSFVRWFECIFRLCRWLHPSFRRSPQNKSRTSGQKIVEKDDFSLDKAHFGSVQL